MNRDPFYQKILSGLRNPLDDELFEQCAADILRIDFPTLVPIRGGNDAGMDGAIADGQGLPFPLVSTTSNDCIGNLTRNLKSYSEKGGLRRKVVFATSRALTQKRRSYLEKRAGELGFVLVQTYDQAAIANRLYRNAAWCRELLNLTGSPSALSILPLTYRPLLGEVLVGREQSFHWLQETTDDRLVVGMPGSGKTFLFHLYAKIGGGLFVVQKNLAAVAEALREQQPTALFVDDAHTQLDFLAELQHLRDEIGVRFSLVANCWPGQTKLVAERLSLPESKIHELPLLTRDEIVQVIKGVGIQGPDNLLYELVNQAEGRPGLAVTLSHLCLQGDVQKVVYGDTLGSFYQNKFDSLLGSQATGILAAFAVGGDKGMHSSDVADVLQISHLEVGRNVMELAAGGVIQPTYEDCLAIRPPELRYALVRDFFLRQLCPLPVDPLLDCAPQRDEAIITILRAVARGGILAPVVLRKYLETTEEAEVWKEYAWLGREEATYALQHRLDLLTDLAPPTLNYIPQQIIPLLLDHPQQKDSMFAPSSERSQYVLADWIRTAPLENACLQRRQTLADNVLAWMKAGGCRSTGLHALTLALAPNFYFQIPHPGSGVSLQGYRGLLNKEELEEVGQIWLRIRNELLPADAADWRKLIDMVKLWMYPALTLGSIVNTDNGEVMRKVAEVMLQDLLEKATGHPGLLLRLAELREQIDLPSPVTVEADFALLYSPSDYEDWLTARKQAIQEVEKLATVWIHQDPGQVAQRLAYFEAEAHLADLCSSDLPYRLCITMAELTDQPERWIEALLAVSPESSSVFPFLEKSLAMKEIVETEYLSLCLERPGLRSRAFYRILTLVSPPLDLLERTLQIAKEMLYEVSSCCQRGEIAPHTLLCLLRHEQADVRLATATGLWCADPFGSGPVDLKVEWRQIILQSEQEDHWLGEILKTDPELAKEWMLRRIEEDTSCRYHLSETERAAIQAFDHAKRCQMLEQALPLTMWGQQLVNALVNGNITLFSELLSHTNLQPLHLSPLAGCPPDNWSTMLTLALDAGYPLEKLVRAIYPSRWSFVGHISTMYKQWADRFETLCNEEDPRLRHIGGVARGWAREAQDNALKEERMEAIYRRF